MVKGMNTQQIPYQLAQINLGRLQAPQDDPRMAEFVANLDRINALAEQSPGFVWRLRDDSGNALSYQTLADDPLTIVNLSVWADIASLRRFVYQSQHQALVARRREWFQSFGRPYLALWWIPAGHIPALDEGLDRLAQLQAAGAGATAFNFARTFSWQQAFAAT